MPKIIARWSNFWCSKARAWLESTQDWWKAWARWPSAKPTFAIGAIDSRTETGVFKTTEEVTSLLNLKQKYEWRWSRKLFMKVELGASARYLLNMRFPTARATELLHKTWRWSKNSKSGFPMNWPHHKCKFVGCIRRTICKPLMIKKTTGAYRCHWLPYVAR